MSNINTPKRIKQRIGLIFAIALSFVMVNYLAPKVFIANTPEIDRRALANIFSSGQELLSFMSGQNNSENENENENENTDLSDIPSVPHPADTSYERVAKGVYASEPDETGKRFIKIDKGTKLEKRDVILEDGRSVTVYIPLE
jgi:hypothetical protein